MSRVEPRSIEQVRAAAAAVGPRLEAAVWLAAGMGLRRGDVFGLKVDRVKFLQRRVNVDRQLIDVRGAAYRSSGRRRRSRVCGRSRCRSSLPKPSHVTSRGSARDRRGRCSHVPGQSVAVQDHL